MQVIIIPEATPSLNEIKRKFRNIHVFKKEQTRWDWLILSEWDRQPTMTNCEITITRYGSKLLDWDNMGGGLKFLMDALTHNRVIEDDNPGVVVRLHLEQSKVKRKDTRTVIKIVPGET